MVLFIELKMPSSSVAGLSQQVHCWTFTPAVGNLEGFKGGEAMTAMLEVIKTVGSPFVYISVVTKIQQNPSEPPCHFTIK